MAFEGINAAEKHGVILPDGTELSVTGVRKGTLENPTVVGTDSEGRKVEVIYDTINGKLEVISVTIDGEEQLPADLSMAAYILTTSKNTMKYISLCFLLCMV